MFVISRSSEHSLAGLPALAPVQPRHCSHSSPPTHSPARKVYYEVMKNCKFLLDTFSYQSGTSGASVSGVSHYIILLFNCMIRVPGTRTKYCLEKCCECCPPRPYPYPLSCYYCELEFLNFESDTGSIQN